VSIQRDPETPFATEAIHGGVYKINVNKRYRVLQPSIVAFAMATPSLDDTTTVEEQTLTESQWGRIKYIDFMVEQMMIHQLGLVETGAETPWEEASALIRSYLMPDVHEENAGSWVNPVWQYWGKATMGISVPGRLPKGNISIN